LKNPDGIFAKERKTKAGKFIEILLLGPAGVLRENLERGTIVRDARQ
jgi:hypothetical protein